jgi:hypothetical protein
VIDDLWKESAWDAIKLPFQDGHPRSKIIITTRNRNVAEHVCGGVYELKPLSDDDSRELLSMRIFDRKDGCPHKPCLVCLKVPSFFTLSPSHQFLTACMEY